MESPLAGTSYTTSKLKLQDPRSKRYTEFQDLKDMQSIKPGTQPSEPRVLCDLPAGTAMMLALPPAPRTQSRTPGSLLKGFTAPTWPRGGASWAHTALVLESLASNDISPTQHPVTVRRSSSHPKTSLSWLCEISTR